MLKRKQGFYEKYIKRLLDMICSLLAIIVFCWLYVVLAILVRVKIGKPILFKKPRPGMKGIGILLVVLGHAINSGDVPLCKVIWSFHMPLFFFVSGLLLSGKNYKETSILLFIKKKAVSLLIPHFTLAILTLVSNLLISCVIVKTLTIAEIDYRSPFLNWFLLVLFVAEIIQFLKVKYANYTIVFILLGIEIIAFMLCGFNAIGYLQQIIVALVFSDLGMILRPHIDHFFKESNDQNKVAHYLARGGVGAMLFILTAIISSYNDSVLMYMNQYGNKTVFLVCAMVGILGVVDLANGFNESFFLTFFGKNSIIVYATHFLVYRVMKGMLQHFATSFSFVVFPNFFILFGLAIIAEVVLIIIANKYAPVMFGKQREK